MIISTPRVRLHTTFGRRPDNISEGGCHGYHTDLPSFLKPRSVVVSADDAVKVVVRRSKKTQNDEAIATFDGRRLLIWELMTRYL